MSQETNWYPISNPNARQAPIYSLIVLCVTLIQTVFLYEEAESKHFLELKSLLWASFLSRYVPVSIYRQTVPSCRETLALSERKWTENVLGRRYSSRSAPFSQWESSERVSLSGVSFDNEGATNNTVMHVLSF